MTQYPQYPGYGEFDPRAPARRASILMYVLGAIGVLGGAGLAGTGLVLRDFITQPQFADALQRTHITIAQMQLRMFTTGAICFLGGLFLIVLGVFVRKGGTGSIVTAMLLNIVGLVVVGLMVLSSIVAAGTQKDPTMASGICVLAIPLMLLIVLLIWLVSALRNVPYLRAMDANQYWQSPTGYYPFPPTAAPPPPPPDFQLPHEEKSHE